MKGKTNCWEFKNCGREANGHRVQELGVCPATRETRLDGVHGGWNGGRSCWVVAGSLCGGEVQGTFAQKFNNCNNCDFYNAVKKEEGGGFQLSAVLLNKVRTIGNCKASTTRAGGSDGGIKVRRNHW